MDGGMADFHCNFKGFGVRTARAVFPLLHVVFCPQSSAGEILTIPDNPCPEIGQLPTRIQVNRDGKTTPPRNVVLM
jgi:hypothetical protein